jgi:hypothetical protein
VRLSRLLFILLMSVALVGCGLRRETATSSLPSGDYTNYAAGELQFPVALNGVVVQVNSVRVRPWDSSIAPGYVYIITTLNVTNQSENVVSATDFALVDEYLNVYESWQTNVSFGRDLDTMPEVVERGESVSSHHVFIVPQSTLQANLKMRWESGTHESRIDVSLGDLDQDTP